MNKKDMVLFHVNSKSFDFDFIKSDNSIVLSLGKYYGIFYGKDHVISFKDIQTKKYVIELMKSILNGFYDRDEDEEFNTYILFLSSLRRIIKNSKDDLIILVPSEYYKNFDIRSKFTKNNHEETNDIGSYEKILSYFTNIPKDIIDNIINILELEKDSNKRKTFCDMIQSVYYLYEIDKLERRE